MKRLSNKHSSRYIKLLATAWLSTFLLIGSDVILQAAERPDTRARFVELDSEIQAIKEEILAINQEILLLEASSLYPRGEQLVVLVSIADGK